MSSYSRSPQTREECSDAVPHRTGYLIGTNHVNP